MQVMSRMDTCYHMKIMFSSSVRMAAEFAETIAKRDDVWNVSCSGMDVSFISSGSRMMHKFAQDFERQWLERKIAEAETALMAALPTAPAAPVASEGAPSQPSENFEGVQIILDPSVPLAATVGLEPEGYLLGIEDGAELADGETEEESDAEDFEETNP